MKNLSFAELPWLMRIVCGLALFNMWWSIEEFVIDRFGVWRFLPDYKVGQLCIWDLTVAVGISIMICLLSRGGSSGETK
jgi:hypothetical protein